MNSSGGFFKYPRLCINIGLWAILAATQQWLCVITCVICILNLMRCRCSACRLPDSLCIGLHSIHRTGCMLYGKIYNHSCNSYRRTIHCSQTRRHSRYCRCYGYIPLRSNCRRFYPYMDGMHHNCFGKMGNNSVRMRWEYTCCSHLPCLRSHRECPDMREQRRHLRRN